MILKGRNILADQMEFLSANLPKNSRVLSSINFNDLSRSSREDKAFGFNK
jgi:hypothetical protein